MVARYRVTLTPEERTELKSLVTTGKAAARKIVHARILLLVDRGEEGPGKTTAQVVDALGTSPRTVERVKKQFVEEGLDHAVNPRPRPKRPDKVKIQGKVEEQLITLASSDPPEGRSRWTLQLLADQLVVFTDLESVATETVRTALKKTTLICKP